MFNPIQNTPAPSIRSSRRRQRSSNEGSISQPKAKRLRSALNEKTFLPPDADHAPEIREVKAMRNTSSSKHVNGDAAPLQREVAVRGRKPRAADQSSKGDGTLLLVHEVPCNHIVRANLAFRLRMIHIQSANSQRCQIVFAQILLVWLREYQHRTKLTCLGRQHAIIDSESGYALALTHTHAVIWPYAMNMSSPETFTFALPHPSKHISDPLPLGALVSASASSSEPGVVVVVPATGKVTYWESIASAATLDLRLQRGGVELTIPGLYSGETVVQLVNAESAGFILGMSSGRLAYMSVRDGQGRPMVSVQFLRSGALTSGGGLFGSIRNALSASTWKGDIAAVHAAHSEQVGQRDVVVATTKGKIQAWEVHRGGYSLLVAESDAREPIVMAVKQAAPHLSELNIESFELLDFAFTLNATPGSQVVSSTQLAETPHEDVKLLVLASLKERATAHYVLVEIMLASDGLAVGAVREIKTYTTPVNTRATVKPRLYLPDSALVAYVVFDRAIVVFSMERHSSSDLESPDNQLRRESHLAPQAFEDVIDLREEVNVEIVGSGCEELRASAPSLPSGKDDSKSRRFKPRHPAAVLFVRGGGVLRVAALDAPQLPSLKPQKVTARSKLEQAVFFGTMEQNPLDFSVRQELDFSAEEVGNASIELSLDILSSKVRYIPSTPASVDQSLRKRSKALHDLANYLRASKIKISRAARWTLLGHAEKIAAAGTMWRIYESSLRAKSKGQSRNLFRELVECIHEESKTELVTESGDFDRVRHWFIHDVANMEIALSWTFQIQKLAYQEGQTDTPSVLDLMAQGNEILLGALTTALDFRSDNLESYGLQNEQLEHGILQSGYEFLPQLWTSHAFIARNALKQSSLTAYLLKQNFEQDEHDAHLIRLFETLSLDQPSMIDNFLRVNIERGRWISANGSPADQISAEETKLEVAQAEREQLVWLAESGLIDEAMQLGEKYELLGTLSVISLDLVMGLIQAGAQETPAGVTKSQQVQNRIKGYFAKFGSRWAAAFFDEQIAGNYQGSLEYLFEGFPDEVEQRYLSEFLHSNSHYAKLSWIQEVIQHQNAKSASESLLLIGLHQEQHLWSKEIELSIGKIASLASKNSDDSSLDTEVVDNELALISIQQQVYDHVYPAVKDSLDDEAADTLVLEVHGSDKLKHRRQLATLLENAVKSLLRQEPLDALTLIDLLTLMKPSDQEYDFQGYRFYLALEATRRGVSKHHEKQLVQRIIWRRCMLEDDWSQLDNTQSKDDEQVSDELRQTALYGAIVACLKNGRLTLISLQKYC